MHRRRSSSIQVWKEAVIDGLARLKEGFAARLTRTPLHLPDEESHHLDGSSVASTAGSSRDLAVTDAHNSARPPPAELGRGVVQQQRRSGGLSPPQPCLAPGARRSRIAVSVVVPCPKQHLNIAEAAGELRADIRERESRDGDQGSHEPGKPMCAIPKAAFASPSSSSTETHTAYTTGGKGGVEKAATAKTSSARRGRTVQSASWESTIKLDVVRADEDRAADRKKEGGTPQNVETTSAQRMVEGIGGRKNGIARATTGSESVMAWSDSAARDLLKEYHDEQVTGTTAGATLYAFHYRDLNVVSPSIDIQCLYS